MEPLRPDFRQALKEVHPGLTDELIDEYEKLTAMRYRLDQQSFRGPVEEIDRKRDELLKAHMPHFAAVAQTVVERRKAERPKAGPSFKIEIASGGSKDQGK